MTDWYKCNQCNKLVDEFQQKLLEDHLCEDCRAKKLRYGCLAIRLCESGGVEIVEAEFDSRLSVYWWLLRHFNYTVWKVYNRHTKRDWFR